MDNKKCNDSNSSCNSVGDSLMNSKTRPNAVITVLVIFVCFISQTLSMGFFMSFGTIYMELIDIFEITETRAAWIGSIGLSVCYAMGSVSSLLSKKFGCGIIISLGGVLIGSGLLLSSVAADVLTLTFTFSGLASVGCSFLFFASLSSLPHHFNSGLCIATSVVSSGSNFSGIVFSPLITHLIKQYNLRVCFQMFSIAALIPILGGLIMHRYCRPSSKEESVVVHTVGESLRTLARNKRLLVVLLAMSLIELCYFIPYIHLVNFGIHKGVPLVKATWLPVTLSIGGWCGKITFGLVGQIKYVNIIYLFQIFLLVMAVCLILLPLATSFGHFILFSAIYGVFDGAFNGYILPIIATTVSSNQIGVALGALYTFISVELLLGAPIAGFLYMITSSYQIPFFLCGVIMLSAALVLFCISNNNHEPAPQLITEKEDLNVGVGRLKKLLLELKLRPRVQKSKIVKMITKIIDHRPSKVNTTSSKLLEDYHLSTSREINDQISSSHIIDKEESYFLSLEPTFEKVDVVSQKSSSCSYKVNIEQTQCSKNSNIIKINNRIGNTLPLKGIVQKKNSIVELHHSKTTKTHVIDVDKNKHCREEQVNLTDYLHHFVSVYSQINVSQASLSQANLCRV